jgi:hypothetical protein
VLELFSTQHAVDFPDCDRGFADAEAYDPVFEACERMGDLALADRALMQCHVAKIELTRVRVSTTHGTFTTPTGHIL